MKKKSFKKNVILNYFGQLYTILSGFLFLPILMKKIGAEGYGLIGFYSMLQVWFMFLDFGLSPATSRETSKFCSNEISKEVFDKSFKALSFLFWTVTILGTTVLFVSTPVIQHSWLKIDNLNTHDVLTSLMVISFSVTLRWQGGLYRGVLTGTEQFDWLSLLSIFVSTLRFIGVFVYLIFFGYTIKNYFIYQFLVVILEFVLLFNRSNKFTGKFFNLFKMKKADFSGLSNLLKFSSTFAIGTFFWIFINQADKLFLSGMISLRDYGYFSLAMSVTNGVATLATPIMSVIMPRMAYLFMTKKYDELKEVYHLATQSVSVLVGAAAITLFFTAHSFLQLWTGSLEVADKSAIVLQIYVLSSFISSMTAFSFCYQYAIGDMKLNVIGSMGQAILFCPLFYLSASKWGAIGSGCSLLFVNCVYLIFWVPYIYKKLNFNIAHDWFVRDILIVLLPTLLSCFALRKLVNFNNSTKSGLFIEVLSFTLLSIIVSVISASKLRNKIYQELKSFLIKESMS